MPNRIIKESILTSPTLAKLSPESERHFYRCLLLSDDWGCFECSPAVLRGRCYPHFNSTVDDVDNWTNELEQNGILRRWEQDGREYAVILKFDTHNKYGVDDSGKQTKHRRKTPQPPNSTTSCDTLEHLPTSTDTCRQVPETTSPIPTPTPTPTPNPIPNPNPIHKDTKKKGRTVSSDKDKKPSERICPEETPEWARKQQQAEIAKNMADAETKEAQKKAFIARDYITEVINKCTGKAGINDHPRAGLWYMIGLEVPEPVWRDALRAMQDQNERNKDKEQKHVVNLESYFVAIVRNKCKEQGIETTIEWSDK